MSFDPLATLHANLELISSDMRDFGNGKIGTNCRLCGISNLATDQLQQHVREPSHIERSKQFRNVIEAERAFLNRRKEVSTRKPRISKLGARAWRDSVNSALLTYLMDNDRASYVLAEKLIVKYEYMEPVSLLELAVWKSVCQIAHPPDNANDAIFWQRWLNAGWKAKKNEMRPSNAIFIVMTNVLPFLGRPPSAR